MLEEEEKRERRREERRERKNSQKRKKNEMFLASVEPYSNLELTDCYIVKRREIDRKLRRVSSIHYFCFEPRY